MGWLCSNGTLGSVYEVDNRFDACSVSGRKGGGMKRKAVWCWRVVVLYGLLAREPVDLNNGPDVRLMSVGQGQPALKSVSRNWCRPD